MDQNLRDGTKFNRYIFERTHHFSEHGERGQCHVTYEFIRDWLQRGDANAQVSLDPLLLHATCNQRLMQISI